MIDMSTSPDTRDHHGLPNKLHSRATEAIFSGAKWLTSQQVSSLVHPDTDGRHREVARWVAKGELFTVERDGEAVLPRYTLGVDFVPLPVIKEVLTILNGWNSLSVASWFESTSSFLAGRRPRELLASDPALVIEAALDAKPMGVALTP